MIPTQQERFATGFESDNLDLNPRIPTRDLGEVTSSSLSFPIYKMDSTVCLVMLKGIFKLVYSCHQYDWKPLSEGLQMVCLLFPGPPAKGGSEPVQSWSCTPGSFPRSLCET